MARDGSVFRYDPDYLREQFAGLVIQRALPFNHEQTTRVFQKTMQPRYSWMLQASLTAEDILNQWPETEVGRIIRDYGEENNWRALQKRIVKARLNGGLHSTSDLVDLIRSSTSGAKVGRQGWIKTATRVFQALRIAVNDELKTLETSLYDSFSCLAPGGRLAVISFHSLEDRIVKQTFLDIIKSSSDDGNKKPSDLKNVNLEHDEEETKEPWIKQMIEGVGGTILTKRPITPSEDEEKLNVRCRSAKLRVIQKD
uniref:MraW methylase family protein n=1 Tax=Tanacetum cinerariifolium TaxID=118510 RepID=A0A699H7N2_TANCI|nr:MraW methylase family protein [Tanacetum cinerariifolium]